MADVNYAEKAMLMREREMGRIGNDITTFQAQLAELQKAGLGKGFAEYDALQRKINNAQRLYKQEEQSYNAIKQLADRKAAVEWARETAATRADQINDKAGRQVTTADEVIEQSTGNSRGFNGNWFGIGQMDKDAITAWTDSMVNTIQGADGIKTKRATPSTTTAVTNKATSKTPVPVRNTVPPAKTTTAPTTAKPVAKTTPVTANKGATKATATKTAAPAKTTTAPQTPAVAPTMQPVPSSVAVGEQIAPLQSGAQQYVLPSGAVQSGAVGINPIAVNGDNGGLQHGALNALYQSKDRAPSLGEMMAFASIMQGRNTLGGLSDITKTTQDADMMNAYAAQGAVANEVQSLMAQGRSADEARYEALTNHLLANGQARSAMATTMPEYARQADIRAGREMDAIIAAGGDYNGRGSFGYTPYGVRAVSTNGDGSRNININGNTVSQVAPEIANMSIYGAIKGDGSGIKSATDYGINYDKQRLANEVLIMNAQNGLNGRSSGTTSTSTSGIPASVIRESIKDLSPEDKVKVLRSMGYNIDLPASSAGTTTRGAASVSGVTKD